MSLEVSEIKVWSSNFDSGSQVGYGTITLCEAMTIKYNIVKANDGRFFVSWPQRKNQTSGEYTSYITFPDLDVRNAMGDLIIKEFNKKVGITSGGKTGGKKVDVVVTSKNEPKPTEESSPEEKKVTPSITWG